MIWFLVFQGYVKSPFQVSNNRGATSFGSTSICTGFRVSEANRCERVDIRIIEYVPDETLTVGTMVAVTGTVQEERGKIFLK